MLLVPAVIGIGFFIGQLSCRPPPQSKKNVSRADAPRQDLRAQLPLDPSRDADECHAAHELQQAMGQQCGDRDEGDEKQGFGAAAREHAIEHLHHV